jgi:tryptophan-rich sensory protein
MLLFITIGIVIYLIWKNETKREFMWYDKCMMAFVAIMFILLLLGVLLIAVGFGLGIASLMLI